MKTPRIKQIDGLRGVAACVVAFLFHIRILFSGQGNQFEGIPGMFWVQNYGWSMVDLFFVISGFIFAHCYLAKGSMKRGVTPFSFICARIARLWPLHLVMTIIAAIILSNAESTNIENILLSLSMLHILIDESFALNSPAWSLSVEFLCYIVFMVAALIGRRALIAAIGLAVAWGAFQAVHNSLAPIERGLLGFFSGVALHLLQDRLSSISTPFLAAAALFPFFFVPDNKFNSLVMLTVSWPALILLTIKSKLVGRALGSHLAVWVGDRSYAIYLVHVPIFILGSIGIQASDVTEITTAMWAGIILASYAIIILLSDILYRNLELPAQAYLLGRSTNRAQIKMAKA